MILVKRSRPPRSPADSAPTIFLTGSLVGPVMMRPRESVFTAVVNIRRSKGDSPEGLRIFRSNGAESVCSMGLALTRVIGRNTNHTATKPNDKATANNLILIVYYSRL